MAIDRELQTLPLGKQFGILLRRVRESARLSQLEAGTALSEQFEGTAASWQSIIARIEGGKGPIKPEQLNMFSKVYDVPLERLATVYAAAKIFGRSPRAVAGDSEDAFFISNVVEVKSLAALAEWEAGLRSRYAEDDDLALWIVSPTFVDDEDPRFLGTVAGLICDRVDLTYFVAERDLLPGEKFDRFLDRVTARLCADCDRLSKGRRPSNGFGKVSAYGLSIDDLAWFTSSLVIANPDHIQAGSFDISGYMIVPVEGLHSLGIPIENRQLSGLVSRIKRQIEQIDDGELRREKRLDALSNHPKFQKEFRNG